MFELFCLVPPSKFNIACIKCNNGAGNAFSLGFARHIIVLHKSQKQWLRSSNLVFCHPVFFSFLIDLFAQLLLSKKAKKKQQAFRTQYLVKLISKKNDSTDPFLSSSILIELIEFFEPSFTYQTHFYHLNIFQS